MTRIECRAHPLCLVEWANNEKNRRKRLIHEFQHSGMTEEQARASLDRIDAIHAGIAWKPRRRPNVR